MLWLAIDPPIVSERPLAGPVGQPDPGYHRFFAVRPGKDSSSGRMLWRPNFTCFMGPCGQPRAKQHPSTVQAVRNQGCLLRSALRSAELSNCIPTPHEFYQCKYANFKFSQPPYRPRELDRKSAIYGLTINESTRSGDAGWQKSECRSLFFFKVNYNLEYRLRYGLITKLLVLFEIKNFQMSNSLTDGPTFTFIQTDYVQRM